MKNVYPKDIYEGSLVFNMWELLQRVSVSMPRK